MKYKILSLALGLFFLSGCVGTHPAKFICEAGDDCFESQSEKFQLLVDRVFPEQKFKAQVWTDEIGNAWVIGDGSINISTDLMEQLSEEQIMAVIAHEGAHSIHNHVAKKLITSNAISVAFYAVKMAIPMFPTVLGSLVNNGTLGMYSQSQELDADKKAVDHLVKAGLSPKDMLEMLEWLKGRGQEGESSLFASHPPTQERIDQIQELIDEAEGNTIPAKNESTPTIETAGATKEIFVSTKDVTAPANSVTESNEVISAPVKKVTEPTKEIKEKEIPDLPEDL